MKLIFKWGISISFVSENFTLDYTKKSSIILIFRLFLCFGLDNAFAHETREKLAQNTRTELATGGSESVTTGSGSFFSVADGDQCGVLRRL